MHYLLISSITRQLILNNAEITEHEANPSDDGMLRLSQLHTQNRILFERLHEAWEEEKFNHSNQQANQ